jgi:hypothetical protein
MSIRLHRGDLPDLSLYRRSVAIDGKVLSNSRLAKGLPTLSRFRAATYRRLTCELCWWTLMFSRYFISQDLILALCNTASE